MEDALVSKTQRLVLFLVCLNMADMVSTVLAVSVLKIAVEVNPLMAFFIGIGPWAFVAAKVLLGALGPTLLLRVKSHRAIVWSLQFAVTMYLFLMLTHLIQWVQFALSVLSVRHGIAMRWS